MSEKKGCKCEVYSRVVGYLSPVSEWNKFQRTFFTHWVKNHI
ncbi:MAG: anaerobic ribonucleoside-triphosphate reductase [Clostridiales bacterium]|nr:anaerobic ribonucleoside-triphosphate reductase [Clostridiales bacterium]